MGPNQFKRKGKLRAKQHKIWRAVGPVNNSRMAPITDTLKPSQSFELNSESPAEHGVGGETDGETDDEADNFQNLSLPINPSLILPLLPESNRISVSDSDYSISPDGSLLSLPLT